MPDTAKASYQPFAKPWKIEERGESFTVKDDADRMLSVIYFEDDPIRRDMMKRLSKYDAKRMADQILRLPELLRIEREARSRE